MTDKNYEEKLAKIAKEQDLKNDFKKLDEIEENTKNIQETEEGDTPYMKDLPFTRMGENNQYDKPNGQL